MQPVMSPSTANIDSFIRSVMGRVPVTGVLSRRPLAEPAMTRILTNYLRGGRLASALELPRLHHVQGGLRESVSHLAGKSDVLVAAHVAVLVDDPDGFAARELDDVAMLQHPRHL